MANNNHVLAMFDIRGKQNFIFKTNRIKEIVGASIIIRDLFDDYLYPAAKTHGKGLYHENLDGDFRIENFEQHLSEGYIGEVIYQGGGNCQALFQDEETFKEVTYQFTKRVMEKVGTLQVLCTCIGDLHYDDYNADRERLYAVHQNNENGESIIGPWAALPITLMDRQTSMPVVEKRLERYGKDRALRELTRETDAKLDKYEKEAKKREKEIGETVLDRLAPEKGQDSMLAVVYIDGNSMGARFQEHTKGCRTYDDCISKTRELSKKVKEKMVKEPLDAIDEKLHEIHNDAEDSGKRFVRFVVGEGDEVNLIVAARDAYKVVKTYMKALPHEFSSCAGVSIFHSHAPYADAYRIAEECCETGKQFMKKHKMNSSCFMDYYYCQGGIGMSLEDIRANDEDEELTSLPWLLEMRDDTDSCGATTQEDVDKVVDLLTRLGHSNVKGLMAAAKDSNQKLGMELKRICSHMSVADRDKNDLNGRMNTVNAMENRRKVIYDVVKVYDLWFKDQEGLGKGSKEESHA